MSNPTSVLLSPCSVTWGLLNLGYTFGGVTVDIKTEYVNIHTDEFGTFRDEDVIKRKTLLVTCSFAQGDIASLTNSLASAGTVADSTSLSIYEANGSFIKNTSKTLTLHPLYDTGTNFAQDITVPIAALAGDISTSYKSDAVRVFNVHFMGYPDTSGKIAYFGEPAGVLHDRLGNQLKDRYGRIIFGR